MKFTWFLVLCAISYVICIEHDFKGFDDSILFGINWPGVQDSLDNTFEGDVAPSQEIGNDSNKEVLRVTTSDKEIYECRIPKLEAKESFSIENYDGPSPINLLMPLFSQKICSYRLESYWSYEVCHGRHVRQYHEEREGKSVRLQEYYLGNWDIEKQLRFEDEAKAILEGKERLKTIKVEGKTLPYVEMTMDGGTICDLSGKPRMTRIQYVCYSHGKHEVYSFKETSTCEYEIIILSPLLCEHPQFKPKEVSENFIDCIPKDGAPKKPRNLLKNEADSLRLSHQTIRFMNTNNERDNKDMLAVLKVEKYDKDGETHLKFELHPLEDEPSLPEDATGTAAAVTTPSTFNKPLVLNDDSPVRAFLNGENCLHGGTGWWKYEFCYGQHVLQYHVDRSGEKTTLLLGKFDEAAHLEWIKENKNKAPKPVDQRSSVSHLYSGGDVCDKTGKPRQTEVKLKCLENSSSPAQVSLYLLEPRTCYYILGVESPLICDILPLADDNGLIKQAKPLLAKQAAVRDTSIGDSEDKKDETVTKFGND